MSKSSPVYRKEIDDVALDLLVMDKRRGSLDAREKIESIHDRATGYILCFSISEQAATNEQDASPFFQDPAHLPFEEPQGNERAL